ncbi:FIG00877330: hypothetical protein [Richelia intracellularis HH01]|uniref:NHL repeat-containing protein n=1 Tax=Richelia intracellularis HH01 TaxID=1165094 RepID=M1WYU3_9NOST|nr:hypothetical protein [Richelia intracellularis]CCH66193.1 FIG00877330: hypothetical protein [Richelia intracellularis HH01]
MLHFFRFIKYLFRLSIIRIVIITTVTICICFRGTGVLVTDYTASWIGNSFGGGDKWVQIKIEDMQVDGEGKVYTNSIWDEAGREVGIYHNGNIIGKAEDLHGWGRHGGKAIAIDKKHIYVAMQQSAEVNANGDYPTSGTTWYCVRRYNLAGKAAPFPMGRGWDNSMLIVSTKGAITGLATANQRLYVSDAAANLIRVYDTNNLGKQIISFTVSHPGKITIDRNKNLWLIQENTGKVLHYSPEGKQLSGTINNIGKPTAVVVDRKGRLLVADNGIRQQILIYNIRHNPNLIGTLGTQGGVYADTPGIIADTKLYDLSGLGVDLKGNVYVNSGLHGGTDLRKFSPSGKLQWQLLGLHFIDNVDINPLTDGLDVFAKQEHFHMDYSKPVGKQWKYQAYTLNPFKYPQDPRLHTSPTSVFFRIIQGKPFMFLTDMYNSFLEIYRFNSKTDGEIAIPAGMFVGTNGKGGKAIPGDWLTTQPNKGEWIWCDHNGNGAFDQGEYDSNYDYPYIGGWWVDSKGDIWKTLRTHDGMGIRHYPLQEIDAKGNPIYSYRTMKKQKTPNIFTDLRRIEYIPETDTMYLSGFTKEHPASRDNSKWYGSELVRYDNWNTTYPQQRWRLQVPYNPQDNPEVLTASMSVAGNYIFLVTFKQAKVYIYQANTGKLVKTLKPGKEVASESGWIDIPYGIRAVRRSNGEYLVFVEEDWKGKVVFYKLKF